MKRVLFAVVFLLVVRTSFVKAEEPIKKEEGGSMKKEILVESHKHFSVGCFNNCWEFIDKKERTPEDDVSRENLKFAENELAKVEDKEEKKLLDDDLKKLQTEVSKK
ncbi:hypothetical protein HYY75_13485 [bacterium]|nr:hypothetical protein [bacterium]